MEGEQKSNALPHPETSVSFAPTAPFVRAFGATEAREQQRLFERPSWQQQPAKCTPVDHGEAPTIDPNLVYAVVAGAVLGATVCFVLYLVCKQ